MTDLESITDLLIEYEKENYKLKFVKNLKSGKEASVVLVENISESESLSNMTNISLPRYFALKIYKDLHSRSFVKRSDYLEGIFIKRKSIRHAVQKNTTLGREYLEYRWINSEVNLLKKLSKQTESVPKFYANIKNTLLMEFAGDINTLEPYPRLSDTKLNSKDVKNVFTQIMDFLTEITKLGFVHADLSPYNILINQMSLDNDGNTSPKAIIIDFPQAVNIITNKNAESKFMHDLNMIRLHFESEYNYNIKDIIDKLIYNFHYKVSRG